MSSHFVLSFQCWMHLRRNYVCNAIIINVISRQLRLYYRLFLRYTWFVTRSRSRSQSYASLRAKEFISQRLYERNPFFSKDTLYGRSSYSRYIVSNGNRLKSSFSCAFVRVHTSLLWLRALYVKTCRNSEGKGGREVGEESGTREQPCGPFCGAPFKTTAHSPGKLVFHGYEKTFFRVARNFEVYSEPRLVSFRFVASRRAARLYSCRSESRFPAQYELCNPRETVREGSRDKKRSVFEDG